MRRQRSSSIVRAGLSRVACAQICCTSAEECRSHANFGLMRAWRMSDRRQGLLKSTVTNPQQGTVSQRTPGPAKWCSRGSRGSKIADLDTLVLRAYVSRVTALLRQDRTVAASALSSRQAEASVAAGPRDLGLTSGRASAHSHSARDERADLVYAVKVLVPNRHGALKIGQRET